jgi:3-oxocholest-4-en-26-oate---CoA ligase
MDEHLATIWEALADRLGEQTALWHGATRVSWRAFEQRAARFAAALATAGVGAGDTVAIDMYNCPEYLEVFFAALKIRAVPANVNYRYLDEELRQLLEQSEAVALVYHAALRDRVARAAATMPGLRLVAEVGPGLSADGDASGDAGASADPGAGRYEELIGSCPPAPRIVRPASDVFLSYTGGTTGLPKGVEYVIGDSVRNTRMLGRQMLGLEDIDWDSPALDRALLLTRQRRRPVALPASPLMHSTGLIMASLPVLTVGGTVVTLTGRSFDPDELFAAIAATRPRTLSIAGDAFARPMVHALDRQAAAGPRYDVASLVTITSAGVAWSAGTKRALLAHIPQVTLVDACGSTEGATIGSMVSRRGTALSTDRFVPAPGVRILRADGTAVPPGCDEPGLFCVPTVARGYRNDPQQTAAAFRTISGRRYVCTGDWGRWNPDGTVTLIGRGTSIINTGGEKVFPEEVEKLIRALPAVEDCVVLGVPDERFGQRVAAVVQPSGPGLEELDPATVVAAVRERLAGHKVPRTVLIATVPRAPNGKVLFAEARRLLAKSQVVWGDISAAFQLREQCPATPSPDPVNESPLLK